MHYDAADYPADASKFLPFVVLEAALTQRIWHEDNLQTLDRAAPQWSATQAEGAQAVNALLAAGHSDVPGENFDRAGLLIGYETDGLSPSAKVLSGHDLSPIQHVRRLIMSCCTMGRTEDIFGEPLGMASAAFGYKTRFAVGYLIPVDDMAATLFSAALQHQLARLSVAQSNDDRYWRETFQRTRQTIQRGEWPEGFGEWLSEHLAEAMWLAAPVDSAETKDQRTHWRRALSHLRNDLRLDAKIVRVAKIDVQASIPVIAHSVASGPPPLLRASMRWVICLGG